MNIRSVTAFVDVTTPVQASDFTQVGEILASLRSSLENSGYTVQTTRLATQAFPAILGKDGPGQTVELAKDLEAIAFVNEIDYVALGPVRLSDPPTYIDGLFDVFEATNSVFGSIEIANNTAGVSIPRVRRAADTIGRVATLADGFANLYLTMLANVPPWSPFFPAAYHGGGNTRIAIATESADLAVTAITSATTLQDARNLLIGSIERETSQIEDIVANILPTGSIGWGGIDFSLAPYPEDVRSIGGALEKLGLSVFGGPGSLMAAAFLTDIIERANFTRTGFCGLMLPVLEDNILSDRVRSGDLSITDLLLYSAVCGTGLDTIPLPGTISEDSLMGILLDVSALALRLNKPLTARLMPMPGKSVGEPITFDFEYFADSVVMHAPEEALSGLLSGEESIELRHIRS